MTDTSRRFIVLHYPDASPRPHYVVIDNSMSGFTDTVYDNQIVYESLSLDAAETKADTLNNSEKGTCA
jgi:hypothetical protein